MSSKKSPESHQAQHYEVGDFTPHHDKHELGNLQGAMARAAAVGDHAIRAIYWKEQAAFVVPDRVVQRQFPDLAEQFNVRGSGFVMYDAGDGIFVPDPVDYSYAHNGDSTTAEG